MLNCLRVCITEWTNVKDFYKEVLRMNHIKIKNETKVSASMPISLKNGNIVLHFNRFEKIVNCYMVISFRDVDGHYKGEFNRCSYCSLLNLDTGCIEFEERCSRNTTVQRVLSHLNQLDLGGVNAVNEGQYVKVYTNEEYHIELTLTK